VDERRGSWLDRLACLAGRGCEETAPAVIGIAVIIPIAVLAALVTGVAVLIWLALR
jgi:hypothetical protein